MRPFERFLVGLDSWPWSAFVRVLIGLCSPPVSRTLFGGNSVWVFPAFFVASLIALRVVPALIRFALPFSAEAKEIWARRRALAKRYDLTNGKRCSGSDSACCLMPQLLAKLRPAKSWSPSFVWSAEAGDSGSGSRWAVRGPLCKPKTCCS